MFLLDEMGRLENEMAGLDKSSVPGVGIGRSRAFW